MGLSHDDVIRVLKLIDESPFDTLRLTMDGLDLTVARRGVDCSVEIIADIGERPENRSSSTPAAQPPIRSDSDAPSAGDGSVEITAPTLGTFYVAPKPGAEPFVREGTIVGEADTICIIEIMKLFTNLKAGVAGRIVKVCAQDGELVEYGQVLFLVAPAEQQGNLGI